MHPIIVGDRWYACAQFLAHLVDVEACYLLRVKSAIGSSIVLPRHAYPASWEPVARMGDRFQCQDESSHGEPDETWEGLDAKGAQIQVRCWNHLHLRTARWMEASVIQIIRHGASGKARDRQPSVGSGASFGGRHLSALGNTPLGPDVGANSTSHAPGLLIQLRTPARPPQPRGKAPGCTKGFHPKPAPRHPVIRKTSKKVKKRKTAPAL